MEAVLTEKKSLNFSVTFGGALLLSILLFALLTPQTAIFEVNLTSKNLSPSASHWFGTDDLGRDLFARCAYGARISLSVGFIAVLVDLIVGVLYGGIAAYFAGAVGENMMRLANIFYSFPYLLVVITATMILGNSFPSLLVSLTLFGWITMARVTQGVMNTLMHEEFVLAAKTLGASPFWIFRKHLVPNALGPIIATATLTVPSVIFAEAFLSFLGLGLQAPIASLGTMASDGLHALQYYPWCLGFPAFFISATMLSFNLLGDALNDAFDPLERRRG